MDDDAIGRSLKRKKWERAKILDENNGNWQNWQRENKQRKSEETLAKGIKMD
jgi:hypothetical protein